VSTSLLSLHSNTSHKFYTIINGVGDIAVANVYSMDFDNNGIRTMITHVLFNQHKSFTTHQEAWTFFVAFFPHIKSPDEATFMNENCIRNGFMSHIMGHKLSHIYAREVR
jgi:hypothetical protein